MLASVVKVSRVDVLFSCEERLLATDTGTRRLREILTMQRPISKDCRRRPAMLTR